MKKWMAAGGGLLLISGWLLWHGAATLPIRSGACAGCNVLLITIDTLRSDRVGTFGGPTPHQRTDPGGEFAKPACGSIGCKNWYCVV